MKKYLVLLLLLCLALTLPVAAADAEAEYYCEIGPVVDALRDPPVYYAQSGETPYWDADVDCYGDVLEGIGRDIYEELENRFAAHAAGTKEIPLQMVNFQSGKQLAWTFEAIAARECSTAAERDAWLDEANSMAYDAVRAFVYDHPEYFWVREHSAVGWSYHGNYAQINLYYIAQKGFEDLEEQQAAINRTVAQLTAAVEGLSDAQKIAWWDNWLAVNNRYKSAALAEDYILTDATPWCVVGSLLPDYQPVCEGYAKALQLLCHEAGIPCVQQSGIAGGGGHMWAAVKLDGQWYFCDPTWDDPGSDNTSMDFSVRDYLLTSQPSSHGSQYYPSLGLPRISYSAYQIPMKNDFGWSAAADHTPLGYEVGNGTMIIALYDQDGRFLTMGACSSIRWDWYDNIYLAPAFSDDVLAETGSIVRFCLTDAVNWKPAAAQAPIR